MTRKERILHPRPATLTEFLQFLDGKTGSKQGFWYGVGAGIGFSIGVAGIILLLVVLL